MKKTALLFVLTLTAAAAAWLAFANNVVAIVNWWKSFAAAGGDTSGVAAKAGGFLPWLDWSVVDYSAVTTFIPALGFTCMTFALGRLLARRKTNAAEILFGMLLLIIAFSLVLPILEDGIPDFGSALWYCFAIISTIGFGDVSAVSVLGRIMSAILGVCGLVVVSVVMSIVVNFYNETKDLKD